MVFPSVRTMEGGAAASAEKAADSASYTYWVQKASRDAVPKKIDPADLCNQLTQSHLGSVNAEEIIRLVANCRPWIRFSKGCSEECEPEA